MDDDEDYALPHWAGVVPVRQVLGTPLADPRLSEHTDEVPLPAYLASLGD